MKFCDILTLLLYIIYGNIATAFYILKECFFTIIPRKQKSIKDEIVVVTGAGHGLGRRIAISLSRLGAVVVCWDMNGETNTNTVWDIRHDGGKAHGYTVDVRDRQAVMDAASQVVKDVGPVSILFNNAGIYLPVKPVMDWTPEQLRDVFETNVMAHFWTMKAFLPAMIERNYGHVVAIASAAGILPVAHETPYSASKAAVSGLMNGMIQELRLNNPNNRVKITCVHPYYTAVREDIPVKYDLRIERMSPDYVAAEIIKGFRQNREMITVPRFMHFWISFVRCLPSGAQKLWREKIFYTRVFEAEMPAKVNMVSVEEKFRCAEKLTEVETAVPVPVTIDMQTPVHEDSATEMKNSVIHAAKPSDEGSSPAAGTEFDDSNVREHVEEIAAEVTSQDEMTKI